MAHAFDPRTAGARLLVFVLCGAAALLAPAPTRAQATADFPTTARAAILTDAETGEVLYAKNADLSIPPASMSKLMTAVMVFERLEDGRLRLDDRLPVSEKAWRMGGSRMFVEAGDRVAVEDLLRGIIIQSGNDACVVVAEAIGGTEERFAALMTEEARALGLENSTFENASGLPAPGHRMTVHDLARLARVIVSRYPRFYHFYGEDSYTYNGIAQRSRNPLLRAGIEGVDGLKTGHTEEAGYGLVASAKRGDRRLIMVAAGFGSERERAAESERLLEHGFRDFDSYALFEAGETVARAPVWLGERPEVDLVTPRAVTLTLPREARDGLRVRLVHDSPLPAPVAAGAEVARLEITAPGVRPRSVPLLAGAAVGEAGPVDRLLGALDHLVRGRS